MTNTEGGRYRICQFSNKSLIYR